MGVKLGNGNWAVKEDKLLAYNDKSGKFFNKEFDFTRGSSATYVAKDGLIKTSTGDTPRIDFSDSPKGALLLEPSSTNLVNYSQDFTQYNNISNSTVISNDVISPDGTQNASRLTISGALPYFAPFHPAGFTSGTVYTMSCFVKKGTQRWVRLVNQTSSSTGAWFDLDNNVVGTTKAAVISAKITNYGNGWYRISSTLTAVNTNNNNFLGLSDSDDSISVSAENIGNTVYFWGFQIQQQNVLTSYIPTYGTTATRLAETCNNSGSEQDFNSDEGVLYAEIAALANSGTFRQIAITDGTTNNSLDVYYRTTDNQITFRLKSSGTQYIFESFTIDNVLNFNKIAFKYKSGESKVFINGSLKQTYTNTTMPLNLSKLNFVQNGNPFYGKTRNLRVYTEALTDAELQELTS